MKNEKEMYDLGSKASLIEKRRQILYPEVNLLEKKQSLRTAVSEFLILHRKKKNMSQKELAQHIKTSVLTIKRIEACQLTPSLETLQSCALAFGGKLQLSVLEKK